MALGDLGRTLVLLGLLLTAAGLIMWLLGALPFVGRLPGDISMELRQPRARREADHRLLNAFVLSVSRSSNARCAP